MYFAFFILLSVFLHGKQTDGLYICLASYVISVRRTKSLLTASFRFYLTIDTLAVQLYTSLSPRRVRDFHPLERAHGAQTKRAAYFSRSTQILYTFDNFLSSNIRSTGCAPFLVSSMISFGDIFTWRRELYSRILRISSTVNFSLTSGFIFFISFQQYRRRIN